MVNYDNLSYKDLLIRFRQLVPFQQAVVVGLLIFVIYSAYDYIFLKHSLVESVSSSIYSSILFMVVFYFTTVLILRKSTDIIKQSKGPKKGQRNK
ncbi:MAG: hypothetical protein A4E48_01300 [Methanosaeta sp. PtaU1.Bin060]|jgi:hypothetical protein|nr:MAG: hypothetical protein A4E48_01300 [Methanosaeta sp. PtaU1.Bin060]